MLYFATGTVTGEETEEIGSCRDMLVFGVPELLLGVDVLALAYQSTPTVVYPKNAVVELVGIEYSDNTPLVIDTIAIGRDDIGEA